MLSFGIRLILLLLLIGGAIAIIGNYIGRSIGRRRLTIFNLRPRYTANAITIISGILIVFTTLGTILMTSQDARTALFGLEELRKDVAAKSSQLEKTKDELSLRISEKDKIDQELVAAKNDLASMKTKLKTARGEIVSLEKTREKLGKEVEVSRKGRLLFKVDEAILTSLIQAGPEKQKLAVGLKQILSATDAYVRSFGITNKKHLIFVSPEEFDRAVSILQERRDENIVKVVAKRNTLYGEEVAIRFEVLANSLIYPAGQEISETAIDQSLSVPEIEQKIKKLLSTTRLQAKRAGVLPDASGSVGSVPYSKIFSLAKKIKKQKKGVVLKTIAQSRTYTIGPLEVDFKTYYQ